MKKKIRLCCKRGYFFVITSLIEGHIFYCRAYFCLLVILLSTGTVLEVYQLYQKKKGTKVENGTFNKFLLGFGIYNNTSRLMNTNIPKGADHLGCIDGIRFLSMSWVVLCHSWGTAFDNPLFDKNYGVLATAQDSILINAILNGFPSVDSFFLISGVLLTYLTLKELEKTKGRVNIGLFYLHRYLRLTGTYLIIIGFTATLYRYCCPGPRCQEIEFAAQGCQNDWYRNILYINNFGSGNGENFATVSFLHLTQIYVIKVCFHISVWVKLGTCLMTCKCSLLAH